MLEKIQQSYQLTSCLSKKQRKNEVTNVFLFFTSQIQVFSKTIKISAPNSFFQKNDKILRFIGGLFQQVLLTWKSVRILKSKIEFRRLMEKMKKRFWTSWRSMKSTDIWRSGIGFGRRICKVRKGAQVENLLFYWFVCASVDHRRFLF